MKQSVKIKVFTVNYFILHISTYYTIIIFILYYFILYIFFIFYFYFIFVESFDLLYFERTPRHDTPIWKCVSAVAVRL